MSFTPFKAAGLASLLILTGLALVPQVAAGSCPPDRTFSGTLLPGETDVINVNITARGNTTFQFIPAWPFWGSTGQWVVMKLHGNSIAGTGSLAFMVRNAAPGIYEIELRGYYLGMDGMATLPYQLVVKQRDCHP